MSWYVHIIGSPAAVKAAVANEQHMPQAVKDSIAAVADATKAGFDIVLETSGHISEYGSKIELKAYSLVRAAEPAPAPVVDPTPAPVDVAPTPAPAVDPNSAPVNDPTAPPTIAPPAPPVDVPTNTPAAPADSTTTGPAPAAQA